MEASYRELLTLEAEIAVATNTKREIKSSAEKMGRALRRVVHYAKTTGRVKPLRSSVGAQTEERGVSEASEGVARVVDTSAMLEIINEKLTAQQSAIDGLRVSEPIRHSQNACNRYRTTLLRALISKKQYSKSAKK